MNRQAVPPVPGANAMRALVVDDEAPARAELSYLLADDPLIESVTTSATADETLRMLGDGAFDVVFCDIKLPGLDGLELVRVLNQFADPPHVVFVTAYDTHAVKAFELQAIDYVMKPVREERLTEAVRRVAAVRSGRSANDEDETIAVELGGVTRFVKRSQISYVEAHGDYARLHTAGESHLLRCTLSELEERWSSAGFVRIHRSTLVALVHIDEIRAVDGRYSVVVDGVELPVSRRHSRELRDRLIER